jgi:predicted DCC family thiol-disulfide oxidoreductase YuxK
VPDQTKVTNRTILFYDGDCALCHAAVKFSIAHLRNEKVFYAPIGGEIFKEYFSESEQQELPDSIIIANEEKILFQSDAVIWLLNNCNPPWNFFGTLLNLFPKFLRDFGYRFVAKIRKKIFPSPQGWCPVPTKLDLFLK